MTKSEKIKLGAKYLPYHGTTLKNALVSLARGYCGVNDEPNMSETEKADDSITMVIIAAENGDDPDFFPWDFVSYYRSLTDLKLTELNRLVRK